MFFIPGVRENRLFESCDKDLSENARADFRDYKFRNAGKLAAE
jgi:hypothetical protein